MVEEYQADCNFMVKKIDKTVISPEYKKRVEDFVEGCLR